MKKMLVKMQYKIQLGLDFLSIVLYQYILCQSLDILIIFFNGDLYIFEVVSDLFSLGFRKLFMKNREVCQEVI